MKTEEQRLAHNAYMRAFIKKPEQVEKRRARYKARVAAARLLDPKWREKTLDRSISAHLRYRKAHPDRVTNARRLSRYGITSIEYDARLASQNNICALCHKPFDTSVELLKPVLDHCHTTDRLREFLHRSCNLAVEHLRESAENARFAAEYLEKHRERACRIHRDVKAGKTTHPSNCRWSGSL